MVILNAESEPLEPRAISIWEVEPHSGVEILFFTGSGEAHLGWILGYEKLRKCKFYSMCDKKEYECDELTPLEFRVTHWFPVPFPKLKEEEILS